MNLVSLTQEYEISNTNIDSNHQNSKLFDKNHYHFSEKLTRIRNLIIVGKLIGL